MVGLGDMVCWLGLMGCLSSGMGGVTIRLTLLKLGVLRLISWWSKNMV